MLPVRVSKAIAGATCPNGAHSPIMRRRTASSKLQAMPASPPPTATCHTCNRPSPASAARLAEITVVPNNCPSSNLRRSKASAMTPASVPRSSIGSWRATIMSATRRLECVACQVKMPATSNSSQRMPLPIAPALHSRR